jgi:hypothetical protein
MLCLTCRALLGCIVLLSAITSVAQSVVIVSGKSAILGSAYDPSKQDFISQECVSGTEVATGSMQSSLHLDQSMSQQQVEQALGLSVGLRARYGAVDISGSAKFLSESASSSYSVSSVYSAFYEFQTKKLVSVTKNSLGTQLAPNFERWLTSCGDSFVDEIHTGARLFFSIRVDFSSESQKQQFEASFSVSGPMAGVDATLKQASKQFSRNTHVTVSAYQIGGDVSKLSGIFGDKAEATQAYVQCTLGNFDDCSSVLANALTYATNTGTGFPSQITAHPAVTSYGITTYEKAGIYTKPYPFLSQVVQISREELSELFERTFANYLIASRLLSVTPISFQKPKLQNLKGDLWYNLTQLRKASETCYERPAECPEAVHDRLQLKDAQLVFLLPPTFEEICEEAFKQPSGSPLRNTVEILLFLQFRDVVIEGASVNPEYPRDCHGEFWPDNIEHLDIGFEAQKKAATDVLSGQHHLFSPSEPISDLTPLISMQKLAILEIHNQNVSDLTPLSSIGRLSVLELNRNNISDLRPLAALPRLGVLSINNNDIDDLGPLSTLKHLEILDISHNRVVDLSPLATSKILTSLYAGFNQIADIKPIGDLPELGLVDFTHNVIKGLDGFEAKLRIKELNLQDNFIPTASIDKFCSAEHSCSVRFTNLTDGKVYVCPPTSSANSQ